MQQKTILMILFLPVCIENLLQHHWEIPNKLISFVVVLNLLWFLDDVANSVILLINTIYFNGYWIEQFAKNETTVQKFWLNRKTSSNAQFMTKTGNFYYGESVELDAKFLRLPYKVISMFLSSMMPYLFSFCLSKGGKFAMYIVLPVKVDGLDDLVSRVDSSTIRRTQFLLNLEEVKVLLPRFKIVNTVKLNEVLKSVIIHHKFFC